MCKRERPSVAQHIKRRSFPASKCHGPYLWRKWLCSFMLNKSIVSNMIFVIVKTGLMWMWRQQRSERRGHCVLTRKNRVGWRLCSRINQANYRFTQIWTGALRSFVSSPLLYVIYSPRRQMRRSMLWQLFECYSCSFVWVSFCFPPSVSLCKILENIHLFSSAGRLLSNRVSFFRCPPPQNPRYTPLQFWWQLQSFVTLKWTRELFIG